MIRNLETLRDNGTFAPVETVKIGYDGKPTKFNLVVVDEAHVIDTVTDQYELITNEMLVDSIDRAADVVGLPPLEVSRGYVNTMNGISRIAFNIDDGGLQVPGDPSANMKQLLVSNNYAGRGSFGIAGGVLRMICENGMTVFDTSKEERKRHIGVADLDSWALEVISIFANKQSVFEALAEVASKSDWSPARHGEQLADTAPKRYREKLEEEIKRYTSDLGFNGWAAMQAITDVATHEMKDTVTARRWSDAAIEKVLADIGQTWYAIESVA